MSDVTISQAARSTLIAPASMQDQIVALRQTAGTSLSLTRGGDTSVLRLFGL